MTVNVWGDVINQALLSFGEDRISGFDDGEAGRVANEVWASAVDYVIEKHWWNAPRYFQTLAETTAPPFKWEKAWALPTDPYCLVIVRFNEDNPFTRWQLAGRRILTIEATEAHLEFVGRPASPHELNEQLIQTIVDWMGYRLCMRLTEDSNKRKAAQDAANLAMRQNRSRDSHMTSSPGEPAESVLVVSRGAGGPAINARYEGQP